MQNGLLQNEVKEQPAVLEFALLSEQELDRIETLVQNLWKITKMDTSFIVFEKASENAEDMMQDVELYFAYRAKQEEKEIHPKDLHYIFKRFYRSRFSKDTQGIGLGLPLAKTIIEAHNGTIEVSSQPGVGTVFVMNFLIPAKL